MKTKFCSAAKWMLGLACLSTPSAFAQSDSKEKAEADDADLRNWIEFSVGGNFVHGDKSAFQRRTGQPRDVWGGVTDFHYEQDIGKKGLFEVDGRGIFDAHNYSLSLSLKDPGVGYVKAGFEEFSSYYDGSGGYFAGNGQFFNLYNTDFEVDRQKIYFEAGLTLENKPQVRIRYDYAGRDGIKNSTIWGDTVLTGIPGAAGARKIVPAFTRLNEDRHTVAIDASHTIGKTEAGLGGRYVFSTYDNARYMRRAPTVVATDRFLTHREGQDTDLFSAHAFTDTDLTDDVKLTTAYSFTKLESDISGDRIVGDDYDAAYDRNFAKAREHGFLGLSGGADVHQHVAAVNVMFRPLDHLTIVPSVRVESQEQRGVAGFFDYEITAGAPPAAEENVVNTRKRGFLDVTESIDARYTGLTNWVLYARTEWLQGDGSLSERERFIDDVTATDIVRSTDSTRFTQKYSVGANWYPTRRVNVAAQYYHKERHNEYEHVLAGTGGLYPGFIRDQSFATDDANVRVTFRPLNNLTLVSRYDIQFSTIDSEMGALGEVQSGRSTAHIITESVTWSPIARMYIQASGSYTLDRLSSPADFIIPGLVQVSENNYYTANATVGFALTEKTDLTGNYGFYLSDNYDPTNFATSLAYGAGLEEHTVGGGVVHRFSKRMQWTTRYAFMTSHDATSGGNNDFDAHLLSTTLRFRF